MRIELTENARRVLEARYLRKDRGGRVVETPGALFERVARTVAGAEKLFTGPGDAAKRAEEFFEVLAGLEFLPNSPTLMNAGRPRGQLAACFVLPVEDSLEEIFESLKLMALIQQSGGGTGSSFSRLRPRGDPLEATGGTSSGPVSFLRIFDCATENIRQGGKRQGANMGILRVDHPDIHEFLRAKADGVSFSNFNLSVGVTDEFMGDARGLRSFSLRHPRTGVPVATGLPPPGRDRAGNLADGRSRNRLPRRDQPIQPDARVGADRVHQSLRRGAAAPLRSLQSGLDQSRPDGP